LNSYRVRQQAVFPGCAHEEVETATYAWGEAIWASRGHAHRDQEAHHEVESFG
jgi:hypothetical protein